jgi:predicted dehydrogenase
MVGLGRWGRSLMESVAGKSERIRFAATADPAEGTHLADVLRDGSIQAVVLATPHSLHREQAIAAALAGRHVFCEKPLALCAADAQAMLDACRRAGVVLAVGHNRRFWPAMQALKRIVQGGELGELLHVEGHNSNENSNRVTGGWRTSPAESPGGGFTGAGLHALDAMIMLCGAVRSVQAQLVTHRDAIPPLDAMCALYRFANGASGTLATVRATPFYWRVHAFGSKGSAEVLRETELVMHLSGKPPERRQFDARDSLRAELEAFADAVEGRAPYPIAPEEMLATVIAFEATVLRAAG